MGELKKNNLIPLGKGQGILNRMVQGRVTGETTNTSITNETIFQIREMQHDPSLQAKIGQVKLESLKSPDWRRQLSNFLQTYGRQRSNDFSRIASEETLRNRKDILFSSINDLRKAQQLKTLSQVKPRYLPRLFEIWTEKGISKRTQINYYNVLKWFWRVCGIEIEPIATFAKEKGEFTINRNAENDKSWEGNGVDFNLIYERLHQLDPIAARLALAMKTYGLRLKESICLNPHESESEDGLKIIKGSKTGKEREIIFKNFDEENLKKVLEDMKSEVTAEYFKPWEHLTLKQAKNRMSSVAIKIGLTKNQLGVTWHGLRHEFAINQFEDLTGTTAPVRGGGLLDYKRMIAQRQKITEALGHHRAKVTGSYYGSSLSDQRARDRSFERSLQRIDPAMLDIKNVLIEEGIDKLYLVGVHAKGSRESSLPYELLIEGIIESEKIIEICKVIADIFKNKCNLDCVVLTPRMLSSNRLENIAKEKITLLDLAAETETEQAKLLH